MILCNNVGELLKKTKLSHYEFAKRCGFISNGRVVSNYLVNAERGNQITITTALSIYAEFKKMGLCEKFEDVFWLDAGDEVSKL